MAARLQANLGQAPTGKLVIESPTAFEVWAGSFPFPWQAAPILRPFDVCLRVVCSAQARTRTRTIRTVRSVTSSRHYCLRHHVAAYLHLRLRLREV